MSAACEAETPAPSALAAAHAAIGAGSRSFAGAARLLPRDCRAAAALLYAWCRDCDDVIDGQRLGHDAGRVADLHARLDELRSRTRAALHGGARAEEGPYAGLAWVTRRHGIPQAWPEALLDGFALDTAAARYATLEDTLHYAYHVAGVVGLMMGRVLGVRDDATLDRACDLGIAFQLTNIARDVEDDARLGRVYLPADWLAAAGVPPTAVASPEYAAAVANVRRRLVVAAEPYYRSAAVGIARLPFRAAWAIAAARDVYREIGRALLDGAADPAPRPGRAVVPAGRRWTLLAASCATAAAPRFAAAGAEPCRAGLWTRPS